MWTAEQKTLLNIIYGDDLVLVGDVVVSRDEDKKTCRIINYVGELLVDQPVLAIGRFLGRGGFNYVVITERKVVKTTGGGGSFVSRAATSRHYSNYFMQQGNITQSRNEAQYTEYKYKIFSSDFEYVAAGSARKNGDNDYGNITIEVGGKLVVVNISECMLKSAETFGWRS